MTDPWTIVRGDMPLIATAIHDGHEIHPDSLPHMAIGEEDRLREEDPFTGEIAAISDTRIIVHRSRFEVDLNRPREKAVYRTPDDAWGLNIWKEEIPGPSMNLALQEYDEFNRDVFELLDEWKARFGCFVIYDLHSYNHRREGPGGPEADPQENPEINVGIGTLNIERFGSVADRFVAEMARQTYDDHKLDVRVNVKFKGGDFSRRIHERYPNSACVLAIEFKKFFMDEWTGQAKENAINTLKEDLAATIPGVLEELQKIRDEG